MLGLAGDNGQKPVSARQLAKEQDIPYQLACKILQKLHKAKLVESCMGPNGGFRLSRESSKISLLDIIAAIQGPVRLNRCLLSVSKCQRRPKCAVSKRLAELQRHIDGYLGQTTLDELLAGRFIKTEGERPAKVKKRFVRNRR
jgi:Rrf2 family protein